MVQELPRNVSKKFEVNISNGGLAIEFFLHKCLTGGVVGSRVVVVEILTIIMLTPTWRIGLGYGFGVEQLRFKKQ